MKTISFLIFADIVGKIGRKAIAEKLPGLKGKYKPDLTIANVENLAHGRGITEKSLLEIADAGIEAFTSGHHVWENERGLKLLDDGKWPTLIRPINVDPKLQGKGWCKIPVKDKTIYLLNLQGQLFMPQEVSSIFLSFDRFYSENISDPANSIIIVDVHAETTSEKMAFSHYVDGRANIVFGSHTHVPTSDAKILPNGTIHISDIGMVGAHDSVIGFEKNSSIKRFLQLSTAPYKIPETGLVEINALHVKLNLDGLLDSKLTQIREIVDI
ncbi:MAG: TIGR00282 family metallophosphoesterase [Patescibacteria group bacterium]